MRAESCLVSEVVKAERAAGGDRGALRVCRRRAGRGVAGKWRGGTENQAVAADNAKRGRKVGKAAKRRERKTEAKLKEKMVFV